MSSVKPTPAATPATGQSLTTVVRTFPEDVERTKSLMIDLGVKNFWDIATAIDCARAFQALGVAWLEEPLGHDDPEGYRALRAATGIRIAYGERDWNARGVQRILATGTVDVVGLDPGRVEGITGFSKAAKLCAQPVIARVPGAGTAAVYGPAQNAIVDRPVWHTDGFVNHPQVSGLGIALDEDKVRAMRLEGQGTPHPTISAPAQRPAPSLTGRATVRCGQSRIGRIVRYTALTAANAVSRQAGLPDLTARTWPHRPCGADPGQGVGRPAQDGRQTGKERHEQPSRSPSGPGPRRAAG